MLYSFDSQLRHAFGTSFMGPSKTDRTTFKGFFRHRSELEGGDIMNFYVHGTPLDNVMDHRRSKSTATNDTCMGKSRGVTISKVG